jgi:hypothetical protein
MYQSWAAPLVCMTIAFLGLTYLPWHVLTERHGRGRLRVQDQGSPWMFQSAMPSGLAA